MFRQWLLVQMTDIDETWCKDDAPKVQLISVSIGNTNKSGCLNF
jgi:hypothetical protein